MAKAVRGGWGEQMGGGKVANRPSGAPNQSQIRPAVIGAEANGMARSENSMEER
jgi:hypothetical protein